VLFDLLEASVTPEALLPLTGRRVVRATNLRAGNKRKRSIFSAVFAGRIMKPISSSFMSRAFLTGLNVPAVQIDYQG